MIINQPVNNHEDLLKVVDNMISDESWVYGSRLTLRI